MNFISDNVQFMNCFIECATLPLADVELLENVKSGNLEAITQRINEGYQVNSRSADNYPLLYYAIKADNASLVSILIGHGANPNIIVRNETLLMIAAHKKFNDIVRILINAGANPSYISSQKRTALYYGNDETRAIILGYNGPEYRKRKVYEAVQENSIDGVKYLLKIGKNIDEAGEQGNTPFLLACMSGYAEIAKLLVTFGCNRFVENSDGDNALMLAVKHGRNEVLTILHQAGFRFYDIKNGKSLLMIAIEFNRLDVAKLLLMYGQDITYQDPSGKNALFYAIEYGRSDFIVYLANQNTFNSRVEGCDAMLYACLKGKQAVLEELIKLNFISSKKDAFLMACRGDNVDICNFWIENGVDINSTNSDDESALMISLKYGFQVPGYLLNHNPNVNYINSRGHSAFSYAVLYEKISFLNEMLNRINANNFNAVMNALKLALEMELIDEAKAILEKISLFHDFSMKGLLMICPSKLMRSLFVQMSKSEQQVKIEKDRNILIAASQGNIPEIKYYLLEKSRQLEVRSKIGLTPVLAACSTGQLDALKYLIEIGADLNVMTSKNANALSIACEFGHLNIVKFLIEKHNFDFINFYSDGMTPFCLAAESGHVDILQYLVSKGVDPNQQSQSGEKPIVYAVQNNKQNVLEYLLSMRCNINDISISGDSLVTIAYSKGYKELTQYLIDHGADLSKINNIGMNLLHFTCGKGDLILSELAIHHGLNVNQEREPDKSTPFIMACYSGNVELIKYLQQNGANMKTLTRNSITPFYAACEGGNLQAVQYLLEQGVDTKTRDIYWMSPLLVACKAGRFEVVKFLIENKFDVTEVDVNQCNAFYYSCQSGNVELVKYLFKQSNFDVNQKFWNANTCLHIAAFNGNLDVLKFLIKKKCDVYARTLSGSMAIHMAAKSDKPEVVEYLYKYDKKLLEERGPHYNTPFLIAALNESRKTMKFLLQRKANKLARNDTELTAMHIAAAEGRVNMLARLLKLGFDVDEVLLKETPLSRASLYCQWECVKFLLENGAQMESMTTLSALHRTVQENRLNDFKKLLNLGFDINEEGQNGRTPLIVSVINQYQDFIDYLLNNNVSVNILDTTPFSALNYAIESGNIVTVKKLIDHKADVNVSLNTTTPLIQSISKNQKEVFDLLINSGALIDIPAKSGNFPIHEAAQQKDSIYYIEFLTNRGFYVDFPSLYKRQTPLMFAVDAKNINVIHWILNHGCDIFLRDHDGNSAFSHAMMAMDLDIADEFVKRGVDLNETDSSGNTIVCKLLKKEFLDGVYYLIDRGAMANAYDQDQNTLLIISIEMKNFDLCYYLLDKGAIPDLPGALQLHPIHHAAKFQDEETIKFIQRLIELGEDINVEDQLKETPLSYTNWKQDVPSFNLIQINNRNKPPEDHLNILDFYSRLKNRPVNVIAESVKRNPVAHYIKSVGGRDYKWEHEYESEITNFVTKIRSVKSEIQFQKSLINRIELRNTSMPESHADFDINRHNNQLRDLKLQKLSLYNEVDKINLKMWYYNNL